MNPNLPQIDSIHFLIRHWISARRSISWRDAIGLTTAVFWILFVLRFPIKSAKFRLKTCDFLYDRESAEIGIFAQNISSRKFCLVKIGSLTNTSREECCFTSNNNCQRPTECICKDVQVCLSTGSRLTHINFNREKKQRGAPDQILPTGNGFSLQRSNVD